MFSSSRTRNTVCQACGRSSIPLSQILPACLNCLRTSPDKVESIVLEAHRLSRSPFGLPAVPPRDPSGSPCTICVNHCSIPEGEKGYCGLRTNEKGRVIGVSPQRGRVSWYYDSLPTNCVADWVCPGGTGAGYPQFAHREGPEYGYRNLAVFYLGCSFNCLYCQNWTFRRDLCRQKETTPRELASFASGSTSCICYFGGDPTPQLHHALSVSRLALKNHGNGILRICWETNGSMDRRLLQKMVDVSWPSGGCIKFDLKAWNENVHKALCGVGNKRTLENFVYATSRIPKRPDPPPVVASTLLVPGYIDEVEVEGIANFVASQDVSIPYVLLAFSPQFFMNDLPTTSRDLAERSLAVAKKAGLKRVRIGNIHLLR
jgi:pyruvate formate lyase activating enzyme